MPHSGNPHHKGTKLQIANRFSCLAPESRDPYNQLLDQFLLFPAWRSKIQGDSSFQAKGEKLPKPTFQLELFERRQGGRDKAHARSFEFPTHNFSHSHCVAANMTSTSAARSDFQQIITEEDSKWSDVSYGNKYGKQHDVHLRSDTTGDSTIEHSPCTRMY